MDCLFCALVAGEKDAVILDKTDETIAFAPPDPTSEGHLLVIPKEHYENLFDIPESTFSAVMTHTKSIAERLHTHEFDGINLLHASGEAAQQSVSHFHIHLTPRRSDDELDLWPDTAYEEQEFDSTYQCVRMTLETDDSR